VSSSGCAFVSACLLGISLLLHSPVALGQEKQVPPSHEVITLSFAPVVKKAAPAVVNIFSKRKVTSRRSISPLFDDPIFKRFFGEGFGSQPKERIQSSLGSGVLVSPQGLVVTNHHVIEGAAEITVVLPDRREFDAVMVLSDERTDLAVLSIDPGDASLPWLELRDSDEAEVGDLVLALGNPFGVGQTVTSGIISALARTRAGITDFGFFIQTDAAINPGNSGGALITMDGKLIGINTAIFSPSGGSVGIGFAIPSNMARPILDQLREFGRVRRGWLGVRLQAVTQEIAQGLGLEEAAGALITDVTKDGPAATGEIRAGDVIKNFDGKPVVKMRRLPRIVAETPVGKNVEVEIWRNGTKLTLSVTLGEFNKSRKRSRPSPVPNGRCVSRRSASYFRRPPLSCASSSISPTRSRASS